MKESELTVTTCWSVEVGPMGLGPFMTCEGLGMELVMEQREEGGNNGFVWQLPTRVKYSNIKLSRPLCEDTARVVAWLASMAVEPKPADARIRALTADLQPVTVWNLLGVLPVRWTGPSLTTESSKAATETIELAHHGFVLEKG